MPQVYLGEKAEQVGSQWKIGGNLIPADKVYICTGGTPNTAFLKPNNILNATGHVKVSHPPHPPTHTHTTPFHHLRLLAAAGKSISSPSQ